MIRYQYCVILGGADAVSMPPQGVLGSAGGIDLTVNYIWRVIHVCHQYCSSETVVLYSVCGIDMPGSSETVVLYSVCGIDMPCGFLLVANPQW